MVAVNGISRDEDAAREQDAMRKRAQRDAVGLTKFDRDILGGQWVRLEVPFRDRWALRKWADMMRGFLTTIDFYTQQHDLPERTVLFHIQTEARELNKRMREYTGPGRPKKPTEPSTD